MSNRETALVTCGGTTEAIDDVRAITNFSTGRFGHTLAGILSSRGVGVTELCPKSTLERLGSKKNVKYVHYTDTESLKTQMLVADTPTIILHAAAVSDYTPVRTAGKISSDQEELTIHLKRTPKIISSLREAHGKTSFIVGFKLLSGVPEHVLVKAAMEQLKKNRLNMVIANDLQKIGEDGHPVLVCTAEGGVLRFSGSRAEVAEKLVDFILVRARTRWFRSVPENITEDFPLHGYSETLELAHDLNLLYDSSGNVSSRIPGGIVISPRQVDKSQLTPQDGIITQVDLKSSDVLYSGSMKPSIDTGMSAMIYDRYSDIESMIHFHSGWGRMAMETGFPYPCGAVEEAEEIFRVAGDSPTFTSAELIHHGFLMGLTEDDFPRLRAEWKSAVDEYSKHLDEVDELGRLKPELLKPIFDGKKIVGVILDDLSGVSVYLMEVSRGSGIGHKVVGQLIERQRTVKTVDDCGVRDYYKSHGFTEVWDMVDGSWLLTPPPLA